QRAIAERDLLNTLRDIAIAVAGMSGGVHGKGAAAGRSFGHAEHLLSRFFRRRFASDKRAALLRRGRWRSGGECAIETNKIGGWAGGRGSPLPGKHDATAPRRCGKTGNGCRRDSRGGPSGCGFGEGLCRVV